MSKLGMIAALLLFGNQCKVAPQQDLSESESLFGKPQGILVDYNRNGKLDNGDRTNAEWSWSKGGALMMADVVDANGNGQPDGEESGPRSPEMLKQFVSMKIETKGPFTFQHDGGQHVLVFSQDGRNQINANQTLTGPTELLIAARHFAGVNGFWAMSSFR